MGIVFRTLKDVFGKLGYDLVPKKQEEPEVVFQEMATIYQKCIPFTMTSKERIFALYKAVEYIVKNNIPGNFVECGVWRGGSSMVIAETLLKFGVKDRDIYLFDTFEGMSEPTQEDKDAFGKSAGLLLDEQKSDKENSVWCLADIDLVKANMAKTGYPEKRIHFIKGKVEDTIPANIPGSPIALLRLDTDFYESTYHELTHLFPILVQKGVLLIDDYGHWAGAKKAVDQYFEEQKIPVLLNRIDYTGRIALKV